MNTTASSVTLPRTTQRRVLVVDDNVDITTAMGTLLTLIGQDVRIANDGPSAIAIALEYRPDIVFLDLGLPHMDGFEVARKLREQPGGSLLEIIALSGWGDANMRERSTAAGCSQHWLKPIAIQELKAYFASRTTPES